jgi:hypothetical protein
MSREVFSTCNPLAINCVLFQEEARTTLWGAGIYYDGVTCWDVNSSGVITGTAVCTTTTSTTSTTSTTTASPTYRLFEADEYICVDGVCEFQQADVLVALQDIYTPNIGKFYELQAGGFYYSLVTEVYTGPGAILNPTNYTLCSSWCSV